MRARRPRCDAPSPARRRGCRTPAAQRGQVARTPAEAAQPCLRTLRSAPQARRTGAAHAPSSTVRRDGADTTAASSAEQRAGTADTRRTPRLQRRAPEHFSDGGAAASESAMLLRDTGWERAVEWWPLSRAMRGITPLRPLCALLQPYRARRRHERAGGAAWRPERRVSSVARRVCRELTCAALQAKSFLRFLFRRIASRRT